MYKYVDLITDGVKTYDLLKENISLYGNIFFWSQNILELG